jgi:hypothetical protein
MAHESIDQALDRFLADQRRRLSERTMRNYKDVVELLRDSLNGYAYMSLDERDHARFEQAFDAGDEEAFCKLFGPELILDHVGEFLGYFMVRKVIAGQELLRAAGTVTKKLAAWLHEQGYVDDDALEIAAERGADAARDLPRAEKLAELLYGESLSVLPSGLDDLPEQDVIEGTLEIERVQPGALFFEGGAGPVAVSKRVSTLAQVGWSVTVVLARLDAAWRIVEVGNVYPG